MYPTRKEEKAVDTRKLYDYIHYDGPLKKAVDIARHYGFNLIEPVSFSRRLPNTLSGSQKERMRKKDLSGFPPGRMSILKKYFDEEMDKWPQPVTISHISDSPQNGINELRLEVIGTSKSFAEALILKTGLTILENWKHQNLCIHLNAMGDRESTENFEKELLAYYRKSLSDLAGCCRQQMKKSVIGVLECQNEKCQIIKEGAPKPINFLNEPSRRHLGEIIEFMESLGLNYKISTSLVGNHYCYPKTVFHIDEEKDSGEDLVLATGERQDHLSKEIGTAKRTPIVSLSLNLKIDQRKKHLYRIKDKVKHPVVYFAHIGYGARLKSLKVIEILRSVKVPINYVIGYDSVSKQLRQAEAEGALYTIILGQKEVMEDSVIWRNMETRYQESIPLEGLADYIKELKRSKVI